MEESTLWQKSLHLIREDSSGFDQIWRQRLRYLDTYNVILMLLHLCAGDEKTYRSALEYMMSDLKAPPAASSFCKARSKMPAYIIGEIRENLLTFWDSETTPKSWFGRQTFAIDGSWLNLPRGLCKGGFSNRSKGYYPQGLLTSVFRISDRMLIDTSIASHFDEREAAKPALDYFTSSDVVVYDRGYFSYIFMLEHMNRNIGAVFRISKGNDLKEIEEAWARKESDFVISIYPGRSTKGKTLEELGANRQTRLKVRVIKYVIDDKEYMLITNVFDEGIRAKDFQDLYAQRWMIEEFLKPYKQTIRIERFHSKSLNGVEQEIQAASLLWNLTMLMDKMIPEELKKTGTQLKNIPLPNELPSIDLLS